MTMPASTPTSPKVDVIQATLTAVVEARKSAFVGSPSSVALL